MPVDKVIINASPLILLFNSDLSFILPELFEEILVPTSVSDEIMNSSHRFDKAAQMLPETEWIQKVSVKNILSDSEIPACGYLMLSYSC